MWTAVRVFINYFTSFVIYTGRPIIHRQYRLGPRFYIIILKNSKLWRKSYWPIFYELANQSNLGILPCHKLWHNFLISFSWQILHLSVTRVQHNGMCWRRNIFMGSVEYGIAELRQIEDYTRPIILLLFIACVKAY